MQSGSALCLLQPSLASMCRNSLANSVPLSVVFYTSMVYRHRTPRQVTTDNGTDFAKDFGHMLARLGCEHITTLVRHSPPSLTRSHKTCKCYMLAVKSAHGMFPPDSKVMLCAQGWWTARQAAAVWSCGGTPAATPLRSCRAQTTSSPSLRSATTSSPSSSGAPRLPTEALGPIIESWLR